MNQTITVRVNGAPIQIPPAIANKFHIEPGRVLTDKEAILIKLATLRARRKAQ